MKELFSSIADANAPAVAADHSTSVVVADGTDPELRQIDQSILVVGCVAILSLLLLLLLLLQ